ncbi:MAG: 6-bladed beta-propeller [Tannerellaceae bacterium]|nr:6-bladed beta-propeller [Tannerellaceae bacterium]
MKRAYLFLLALLLVLYGKEGYRLCTAEDIPTAFKVGSLSDIADKVMAVPLQAGAECKIEKIRNIRQSGNDLFLLSGHTLYRFDRNGAFICQVTQPEMMRVGEYVIDPVAGQLIVIGNERDIHYYSFDGELLDRKRLEHGYEDYRLLSLSFFNGSIWCAEEEVVPAMDSEGFCIERKVVEYDTSFRKLNTYPVIPGDLGREQPLPFWAKPMFSVMPHTGMKYLYNPSLCSDQLIRDTLYMKDHLYESEELNHQDLLPVYPLAVGSRFWLASYQNEDRGELPGYLYCYDWEKNQCWLVEDGLDDNFYRTGKVTDLQRMDVYNQTYCFTKTAAECKDLFPHAGNSVIFIVKLKV